MYRQLEGILPAISSMLSKEAPAERRTVSAELTTIILFFLLSILNRSTEAKQSSPDTFDKKRIRFGPTVQEAKRQLEGLVRIRAEVGYLLASFNNIATYCNPMCPKAGTCH